MGTKRNPVKLLIKAALDQRRIMGSKISPTFVNAGWIYLAHNGYFSESRFSKTHWKKRFHYRNTWTSSVDAVYKQMSKELELHLSLRLGRLSEAFSMSKTEGSTGPSIEMTSPMIAPT